MILLYFYHRKSEQPDSILSNPSNGRCTDYGLNLQATVIFYRAQIKCFRMLKLFWNPLEL